MHVVICDFTPATRTGKAVSNGKVYRFTLRADLACDVGDTVEGEEVRPAGLYSEGEMHAVTVQPLSLDYPDVAVTRAMALSGHDTLSVIDDVTLCSEGTDVQECLNQMVEWLKGTNANALLNLQVESQRKTLSPGVLFKLSAHVAQVRGERYHSPTGLAITLKRNEARRNSPNGAQIRYVRVLLVCALFVAIPCLLRTAQRFELPLNLALAASGILTLLCLILGIIYFPKKQRVFLHRKALNTRRKP